jgi:integrase
VKPSSYVELERHLGKRIKKLHGLQLAKIDRRSIAPLLTEIAANHGPTEANKARAGLSAFFTWAMGEGLAENNPVIATNKAQEGDPRSRVLSDDEMRAVWNALPDDDYGLVVKLLALTGQRREEIGGLRVAEVDLENALIGLPAERTKNSKPHDIPLRPAALSILEARLSQRVLDREYVFGVGKVGYQGWSKKWNLLDEKLAADGKAMPPWVLHDLKRTARTRMHDELGIQPHIVERVLNYISGHRAGVAGTYNRAC